MGPERGPAPSNVQTNFGGILQIAGAPVGIELGQYYLRNQLPPAGHLDNPNGSCMIVLATDAPIGARNLKRLAARALDGLARTGSAASNGSGDYAIAFSTAPALRIPASPPRGTLLLPPAPRLRNDAMSPLFLAAIETTEEAVYNSLFAATTTTGRGHTVQALPLQPTLAILRKYRVIPN